MQLKRDSWMVNLKEQRDRECGQLYGIGTAQGSVMT